MDDFGHWINEQGEQEEDTFGFIYIIENKTLNKKYIGKKQLTRKIKKKPLKGKKNKRIEHKESDWKTYCSSSNELQQDINKYGKENFVFRIIKWCGSKWELQYEEQKLQFDMDVLLKPDQFYNGIVNLRVNRPPKLLLEKLAGK